MLVVLVIRLSWIVSWPSLIKHSTPTTLTRCRSLVALMLMNVFCLPLDVLQQKPCKTGTPALAKCLLAAERDAMNPRVKIYPLLHNTFPCIFARISVLCIGCLRLVLCNCFLTAVPTHNVSAVVLHLACLWQAAPLNNSHGSWSGFTLLYHVPYIFVCFVARAMIVLKMVASQAPLACIEQWRDEPFARLDQYRNRQGPYEHLQPHP